MAHGRADLRTVRGVLARSAVGLIAALALLTAPAGDASGSGPYDLTGVSRIQFTVPAAGPVPEIHANCLARAEQTDVIGDIDDLTLRASCYTSDKSLFGPPPPPPPPPPPYASTGPFILTGTIDQTNGAVELTFLACTPVEVSGVPTGLTVTLSATAAKSGGWLADGSDTVDLNLDQDADPSDCSPGTVISDTVTPTNLALNHEGDIDPSGDPAADGCTTWEELGNIDPDGAGPQGPEHIGGLRDPWNPYDFYDTNGDTTVDLPNDIFGVILRWTPNPTLPYDVAFDRGATIGPGSWNRSEPDGVIDLPTDIFGAILQWQHSCAGAPN